MDNMLYTFLLENYNNDLTQELLRSFKILEDFQLNEIYDDFYDIITRTDSLNNDDMRDLVVNKLADKLKFVLREHKIVIKDDTNIQTINELCNSLLVIQDMSDYTGIIRILESFETDDEKLSLIISDLSVLDQTDVLISLESFEPSILDTLKNFIYTKEIDSQGVKLDEDYKENIALFFKHYNTPTIGSVLLPEVLLGLPIKSYLHYFENELLSLPDETLGLNILSLLMLSSDGNKDPLSTYRAISFNLIQDLNRTSSVEVFIINKIKAFLDFKKANNHAKVSI